MISIKEVMEKKIILNKKGTSLVEVVAALAILAILFVGISGLIFTASKSEKATNNNMDEVAVTQGIRDTLYNKNNKFFNSYLKGKKVTLEGDSLYSIEEMLNSSIEDNSIYKKNENNYISKNDYNNPIKYVITIETREKEKDLYYVVLNTTILEKKDYYYYSSGEKKYNGNVSKKTPLGNSLEMIIRPIN